MPSLCNTEYRVDENALTAYLKSRGLTPNVGKWLTVRYRVLHRFMVPV